MTSQPDTARSGIRWSVIWGGVALALALAIGTLTLGRPASTIDHATAVNPEHAADSLIGLWIDSVGGMDMYHQMQSMSFTVETVLYDTLSGRVKRSRPRYAIIKKGPHGEETRVERWEPFGFVEQGFNGLSEWAMQDGTILPDTSKEWREALYVSRDLFYWMGLPYKLRDGGVILSYRGMVSRPGLEFRPDPTAAGQAPPENGYHAVGVSFELGVGEHQDVFTYYFEPGAGFPIEVTYVEEGRTNVNRMLWGETGRAGDIEYPYPLARDFISASGKRTKALVIYDVEVNPEIPQSAFERPGTTD